MNKDLVRIIENPVILQNLCTMRDKNTDCWHLIKSISIN